MHESGGPAVVTLRPKPWYFLVIAASGFGGAAVYSVVFGSGTWGIAVVGLIVAPIVVALIVKLELSPTGVTLQGVSAPWDQLVLSRGPFGERLRVPEEFAPQRRKRLRLYLPMWEPRWREGAIGDHVRRYATHLLDEV